MPGIYFKVLFYAIFSLYFIVSASLAFESESQEPDQQHLLSGKPFIVVLKPELKNGRGYKLVYLVDVPLIVFWRFKTDFDNDFLVSNKFIESHRFISRQDNIIITEDQYSNKPGKTFRWLTTVFSEKRRLNFKLLNPEECDQKYHYGYIQLEAFGPNTKVTQVAYFDFFGVSLWVNYPFYGGMYDFLIYTARWEQKVMYKLKDRYIKNKE